MKLKRRLVYVLLSLFFKFRIRTLLPMHAASSGAALTSTPHALTAHCERQSPISSAYKQKLFTLAATCK